MDTELVEHTIHEHGAGVDRRNDKSDDPPESTAPELNAPERRPSEPERSNESDR
jgi:hypothetical protein